MTKQEFFSEIEEIITDKIFIGSSIDDLDAEIENNMWCISANKDTCNNLSTEDLVVFFNKVISNRKDQLIKCNSDHSMIFYMWFDVMACQLRFNLISDFHKKLPFNKEISIVKSPDLIIEMFLKSKYHDGIPFIQNYEIEESMDFLNVYQMIL